MSLLQEIIQDTQYFFNTSGITREQFTEFEKVTNLTIGDILYRESQYDLFADWLNKHEELDKKYLFVNYAMIEYLQDKQDKLQQYTKGEKINCYAYNTKTLKYYICLNEAGACKVTEHKITRKTKTYTDELPF